jgi:hypothetical protein
MIYTNNNIIFLSMSLRLSESDNDYISLQDEEPITKNIYGNIPPNRLIKIGQTYYDIETFVKWIRLSRNNSYDPLTRIELSAVELWNIMIKFNTYIENGGRLDNPSPSPVFVFTLNEREIINEEIARANRERELNDNIKNLIRTIQHRVISTPFITPMPQPPRVTQTYDSSMNSIIRSNSTNVSVRPRHPPTIEPLQMNQLVVGQIYMMYAVNENILCKTQPFVGLDRNAPMFGGNGMVTYNNIAMHKFYTIESILQSNILRDSIQNTY